MEVVNINKTEEVAIAVAIKRREEVVIVVAIIHREVVAIVVVTEEDNLDQAIKVIIQGTVAATIETTIEIEITLADSKLDQWSQQRRKCR